MLDAKALAESTAAIIKEHTAPLIARLVAAEKALADLQAREPERGERGAPGECGDQGADGKDGRDGADGKDGEPGRDGADGAPGVDGKDGRDGANGVGLAGAVIDRAGNLVLTLTDGTTRDLGCVVGKDGRDGEDGANGADGNDASPFTLDDFDIVPISERAIEMSFTHGERKHSFELEFPVVIDQGVFKSGEAYVRGDAVTWGGSLWIAQRATESKPDSPASGWRLAVKKGRDGKSAK